MTDDDVRVVVVDDLADAADALAEILRIDGYDVRVAHDGASALSVIAEHRPHCALFDIDMPGLNGAELAARLRDQYGDDIVLIAVTGWGEEDRRVASAFSQADHYLRKPVDTAALRKLLPPLRTTPAER
jgi:DNA-binding response OmpR family regulator